MKNKKFWANFAKGFFIIILFFGIAGMFYFTLRSFGWTAWRGLNLPYCDNLCQMGRMG